MKKSFVCLAAAVLTAVGTGNIGTLVSARTAAPENNIQFHGNKCGKITVNSIIDRDVYVKIECETPDAPAYLYYNEVIKVNDYEKVCDFIVEGDNDAAYKITIGVPKFKGSVQTQDFTDKFYVLDTDEIKNDDVAGYHYKYNVFEADGDRMEKEVIAINKKDGANIINNECDVYFPIMDYLAGDANMDGNVNIRDAAYISKMIAQGKKNQLTASSDFNNDSVVNIRDASAIAKYLAKK